MKKEFEITRYNPNYSTGLNEEQIQERKLHKLNNKTKLTVGKSYAEIIFTNVLSFFNITLFVIAGVMIAWGLYKNLYFLVVLIPNIIIGLTQDIKSRKLMGKLKVLTSPKVTVVRNGKEEVINSADVLLDDIIILKSAAQIPCDGQVVEGSVTVDESLLTGESDKIRKQVGDTVYSGSYVVSGTCYFRADKIGEESYAATLSNKANKFHRSSSEILKSLKGLFRIIGGVVIFMAVFMIVAYVVQGKEWNEKLVASITGSLVAMIPSGLYLLTSVALTLAVGSLAKKQAQVQDFYSVEMLARVNLLCVDKTGTITDGSMLVKQVIPTSIGDSEKSIGQIIANLLAATKDENLTAVSLKKYFTAKPNKTATTVIPFTSENKYSAVAFEKSYTYALGAFEVLPITNKDEIKDNVEQFASKGNRVLVLARGKEVIKENKVRGDVEAVALIVLEDHIRDNARATFAWFNENNVDVKVISGDNAMAVSEIAKNANVKDAEKYVSLAGKSLEETYALAGQYNVFGRVTPEQKETLIKAFKDMGKTVAMTGDGVNDILALKRADCSIALASGADAARNVSHIVLLDNNFDHLPEVVAEGRRVVNNLQRTSSIFLVKTFFAMFLTLFFTILSFFGEKIKYPFTTMNMYPWEIIAIGYAAFFLALQPNKELINGKFLKNIFKKSLPAAAMMIASVLIIFFFNMLQVNHMGYFGLDDFEVTAHLCAAVFSILSIVVLYRIASPLDRFRRNVVIGVGFGVFAVLAYEAIMSYAVLPDPGEAKFAKYDIININFANFDKVAITVGIASLLICFFAYIGGVEIHDLLKKRKAELKDVKDK
ncbi:MAG: HAD-IC family P-type ATPase [Bacilli bacterium]|nr:HAD-IC family P-type ATPase [Bacilli bacterium]